MKILYPCIALLASGAVLAAPAAPVTVEVNGTTVAAGLPTQNVGPYQTVTAGASTDVAHTYASAGAFTISVTATDKDAGTSAPATALISTSLRVAPARRPSCPASTATASSSTRSTRIASRRPTRHAAPGRGPRRRPP